MVYNKKDTSMLEVIKDFKKVYGKVKMGEECCFNGYSIDDMIRVDNMLMVFDNNTHVSRVRSGEYVIETTPRSNKGLI